VNGVRDAAVVIAVATMASAAVTVLFARTCRRARGTRDRTRI
jgi:hypothetical protein